MSIPPEVMEGLLVALGFSGAMTLVWLYRVVARLIYRPLTVTSHFTPGGCIDVLVREIGAARREVLFLAPLIANRPLAQALVDARKRGARVAVALGDGDLGEIPWLREHAVVPTITPRCVRTQLVLLDGKTLLSATFAFSADVDTGVFGQLLVIKGHPQLCAETRRFIESVAEPTPMCVAAPVPPPAAPVTPPSADEIIPPPPAPLVVPPPAPVVQPAPVLSPRPALLPQRPTWDDDEMPEPESNPFLPPVQAPEVATEPLHEPSEEDAGEESELADEEPLVPLSAAGLFARLRQQADQRQTPEEQAA